jgi:hypothetical protein
MTRIPEDSNQPNRVLEYPGYYLPPFFSTMFEELPDFVLPDWGPLPPLLEGRPPETPPPSSPGLPSPIEVDPPARPPEWLFGPPRIVLSAAPDARPPGLLDMITAPPRNRRAETIGKAAATVPVANMLQSGEDNPTSFGRSTDLASIRRLARITTR